MQHSQVLGHQDPVIRTTPPPPSFSLGHCINLPDYRLSHPRKIQPLLCFPFNGYLVSISQRKMAGAWSLTTHLYLVSRLRTSRTMPRLLVHVFMVYTQTTFPLLVLPFIRSTAVNINNMMFYYVRKQI